MAYNFGNAPNPVLDSFPIYSSLANNANIVSNSNYLSQLAAAMTTINSGGSKNVTATLPNKVKRREKTPEAPPAPKISTEHMRRIKPNQGTAPMDIENDETECETLTMTSMAHTSTIPAASTSTTKVATITNINAVATKDINEKDKINSTTTNSMTDANLYLNGLISAPTSYMFFPTSGTTAANAATATMLMDPTTTAMMAAAMQQMQQVYPGFAMPAENNANNTSTGDGTTSTTGGTLKDIIKTKHCILFPPNPDAPPPTIRERPPGCRTVFVGGLPENITEEIIREIFESCGEITTLRMSKKNFCHIRYRTEASIDHAIYLSGYRLRIADASDPMNYGRLHVDYAQARDDQYDYECKQRQLLREQRHRERMALDRSQSPPPIPHYTDHEASLVSEHLRNNETFLKSVQTITIWLERGDCTKRNANAFYSMIQSTHAHVRRLYSDKQVLEQDLRKARESYRKQMLTMSTQFTQIEKVFSAASHKKVWDHFTKAQRKNIDQWKKLASELRSVQIEDDEMEMSDDDRDSRCSSTKKARYDSDSLKEENDSLRCQIDAMRNEMFINRTELRQDSDFREKQIKVLQETIRNMQTQLLQTKMREQKDAKLIEQLECELKEARVRTLLLQTKIKENRVKQKECKPSTNNSSNLSEELSSEGIEEKCSNDVEQQEDAEETENINNNNNNQMQIEIKQNEADIGMINEKVALSNNIEVDDDGDDDAVDAVDDINALDIQKCNEDDDDVRFVSIKHGEINNEFNDGSSVKCSNRRKDNEVVVLLEEDEESTDLIKQQLINEQNVNTEIMLKDNDDDVKKNAKDKIKDFETGNQELKKDSQKENTICKFEEFKALNLKHFEARIIALTVAYLLVQPFGASGSSICTYLSEFIKSNELDIKPLEEILKKYENLFKIIKSNDDNTKAEVENEVKWKFCGFIESDGTRKFLEMKRE